MADETTTTPPAATEPPKAEGKLVSKGVPVAFTPFIRTEDQIPPEGTPPEGTPPAAATTEGTPPEGTPPAATPPEGTPPAATPPEGTPPADDIDEAKLKAYFERQGIAFEGMDKLKEKLNYTPPPPTPTDEETAQAAIKKEKQQLDEHISRKGTPDQFLAFKNILSGDKSALGFNEVIQGYIADGFSKEKAEELASQMYFQLTQAEIDALDDDDDKAEAIKKKEAGLKRLENKGARIQKEVKNYFDDLDRAITDRDSDKVLKETHTANVADAIKNFQRKEQIQLGQLDGVDITPFDFEFPEDVMNQAKDYLSDLPALTDKLITKEGAINISELLPHIARSFAYTKAAKTGFLEGQHRTTEFFQAKFGSVPPPLGGNSKPVGTPGKIVSVGKPEIMQRPQVK